MGIWSDCILGACRGESQAAKTCNDSSSIACNQSLNEPRWTFASRGREDSQILHRRHTRAIRAGSAINIATCLHRLVMRSAVWRQDGSLPARGTSQRRGRRGHAGGPLAAAGMAADLDFLFAAHRGPSHGLGAAAVSSGIVAFLATRQARRLAVGRGRGLRVSHAARLARQRRARAPIGVMALWPFSREFYQSNVQIFHAISRRYWQPEFLMLNSARCGVGGRPAGTSDGARGCGALAPSVLVETPARSSVPDVPPRPCRRSSGHGRYFGSPSPSCSTSRIARHTSRPMKSARVSGPIGWFMPSFITVSIASARADAFHQRVDRLVDHRHQDAVGDESRVVGRFDGRLAELQAQLGGRHHRRRPTSPDRESARRAS